MTKDLTQGAPWKRILLFALPIMAGNLLQQLYNTADTIIVGNFESEQALSSVGACLSLTLLFVALAIGFSIGAGVLVAQYYGAGRLDELRVYVSTALILMVSMGLAVSVVAIFTARPLLAGVLGTPDSLLEGAQLYFAIYAAGLVFQFGYNISAAVLRAVGDSRATLYFLLVSSVVNILLDLLFVAVFHWGIAGAAAATVFSQFLSCATGFVYMFKKYELLRFRRCELRFDRTAAGRILTVGAPMAIQQSVVSCGFLFLQRLVNSYLEPMVASFTVASRVESYLHVPTMAFQNTMATYAGQNMGARKPERVSRGLGQTVLMSAIVTAVLSAALYVLTPSIIAAFGISGQAVVYCTNHLRVSALAATIFAVYFPANGMLQGAGEGFRATFYALMALGLRVLFAYTLSGAAALGCASIWLSQPMAWLITLAACYAHYFRGTWKTKTLVR
jgi:putative MATE family efflux protein